MPRASAPARSSKANTNTNHANNTKPKANTTTNHVKANNTALTNTSGTKATGAKANHTAAATAATTKPVSTGTVNPAATSTTTNPSSGTYTYGSGQNSRSYRAYGYGRGYRNRSTGRRSGYGRSQSNNRAVVSRLRAVRSNLAQIDHNYQGHRVNAMHSISMAIRQLTHRSMVYRGSGFTSGANNNLAMGRRQGNRGVNANANALGRQPLTQAQSDARMSQALRTTQGIHLQLSSQGSSTNGHARARGHVQRAIREMNTALAVR